MKTSIAQADSRVDTAYRHVMQGERNIARQRDIVSRLSSLGYPTYAAQALLATFEKIQISHRGDLERLLALRNRLLELDDFSTAQATRMLG